MPIAFDQNLGSNVPNSPTGSTVVLTTTAAAASLSRIVVWCHNFGAETPSTCSSSPSLTWVRDLLVDDANNCTAAFFSADAPAGLANSSTITVTYSAGPTAVGIGAMSLTGIVGGASGYLTGTGGFSAEFGTTDWVTPNISPNGGNVIISGVYADGAGGATGTVTGPATEVHDTFNATTTAELLTGYRIFTSSQTNVNIAGTFGTAPGEQKYAVIGYLEAATGVDPQVTGYWHDLSGPSTDYGLNAFQEEPFFFPPTAPVVADLPIKWLNAQQARNRAGNF